jgi:hypothetical protein
MKLGLSGLYEALYLYKWGCTANYANYAHHFTSLPNSLSRLEARARISTGNINVRVHFMVSWAASKDRIGRPEALGFYPEGGASGACCRSFCYWVRSGRAAFGGLGGLASLSLKVSWQGAVSAICPSFPWLNQLTLEGN